ncbi:hypothetical protein [Zhouia amylolytica]|uniref:Uncharacterized protein n=1 Tax=Zhouia amylolytica AD3 TaxID=1286632 RepID=W2UPN6_9FLAO|nr:hypothetical protein [Zhouia amylolytica]ETN96150.1 hypothetical protein P278_09510 [Zhouia amylolytica AD3]
MKCIRKTVLTLTLFTLLFSCTNDKIKEEDAIYNKKSLPAFYSDDGTPDDTTIPTNDPDTGSTGDTGDGDGDGTDPDGKG